MFFSIVISFDFWPVVPIRKLLVYYKWFGTSNCCGRLLIIYEVFRTKRSGNERRRIKIFYMIFQYLGNKIHIYKYNCSPSPCLRIMYNLNQFTQYICQLQQNTKKKKLQSMPILHWQKLTIFELQLYFVFRTICLNMFLYFCTENTNLDGIRTGLGRNYVCNTISSSINKKSCPILVLIPSLSRHITLYLFHPNPII